MSYSTTKSHPQPSAPAIPNGAKLKLVGGLKAQIPKVSQPNQTAQAQIDYEALKIEDRSQVNPAQQKGDILVLGEAGKNEQSAIVLKVAPDESDDIQSFDIEGMDWNRCAATWVDDDLVAYLTEDLIEGYLTWDLESSGFWYIYDEVDAVDCAGFYGADWSLMPLPRSRRQAELIDALEESEFIDRCEETD